MYGTRLHLWAQPHNCRRRACRNAGRGGEACERLDEAGQGCLLQVAHGACARTHHNVQPGKYGSPMFNHNFKQVILDALHMAELNVSKIAWKHCILSQASDDARALISEQLHVWKHPLDCRRKDDNRVRAQKWFTGEKWASFCLGIKGSPGGPRAVATIVLIIAQEMQDSGTVAPAVVAPAPVAPAPTRPRGRGRGRVPSRRASSLLRPPPPLPLLPWRRAPRCLTSRRPSSRRRTPKTSK